MSCKYTSTTLGEVRDVLQNLNKVKNFYHRQIACISASIREHEKVERRLSMDTESNHEIHEEMNHIHKKQDGVNMNCSKKQKLNNRFKIRVKSEKNVNKRT